MVRTSPFHGGDTGSNPVKNSFLYLLKKIKRKF